jgi:penicillin-binding protein 2
VAGHRFPCHYAAGHGDLKLRTALAQSCNVFAYRTGLAAGADALVSEARRFHFGEPTGIDLPAETRRMLVPDPAWKQADGRGGWTAGDTANFSIGQGFLRYSPLQAACAIASLARRETLTVPTLLHQPGRHPSGDRPPEPLGLAERDYAALIDGMQAVILIGIGRDAQVPGVSMAGKSGTAQVRRKDGMTNIAWFVAFAPVERPEIAVAVALEGDRPGEEFAGAAHAAPVVREIVGAWSDKRARR